MNPALHSTTEDLSSLDALLADLDDMTGEPTTVAAEESLPEVELEAAVSRAEAQEVVNAAYSEEVEEAPVAPTTTEIDPLDLVTASTEDAPVVEEATAKPKGKGKGKGKGDKKCAEPSEPKEKKERKHYASKIERLNDKLGTTLGDYTVLEINDATLEGDALKAKQDETMEALKTAGTKVQNRMTFLIEFAAGKSAKLNGIATKALELLKKDGKITTGEKGNLHQALIAHPYSVNAAKAMGGNTLLAMQKLKMLVAGEKGEWLPNPNSLYLIKINSMLGLS